MGKDRLKKGETGCGVHQIMVCSVKSDSDLSAAKKH